MIGPVLGVLLCLGQAGDPAPGDVGSRVAAYAQEQLGKKVGDGQCMALPAAALAAAGASGPSRDEQGQPLWGQRVTDLRECRPGDILVFDDTVFVRQQRLPGGGVATYTYHSPHHVAIVTGVQASQTRLLLAVLHQNSGFSSSSAQSKERVQPWIINMAELRRGRLQAFRPVSEEPGSPAPGVDQ